MEHSLPLLPLLLLFLTTSGGRSDSLDGAGIKRIPAKVESPELSPDYRGNVQVIGGNEVVKGSAPWMVSLQTTAYNVAMHYCGGVIIDYVWVLTAAHCVAGYNSNDLLAVAGEHVLDTLEDTEQFRLVSATIVHEHYDSFSGENDLALLKLQDKFRRGKYVHTIDLVERPRPYDNEMCRVYGWGATEANEVSSNVLTAGNQTVCSHSTCQASFPSLFKPSMLCAKDELHGTGPCQGDWGGPLVCRGGELAGIASWGAGCGTDRFPAVYTNVTLFYEWVVDIVEMWHQKDQNLL